MDFDTENVYVFSSPIAQDRLVWAEALKDLVLKIGRNSGHKWVSILMKCDLG